MKLNLKTTLVGLVLTLCIMATGVIGWALHSIGSLNDGVAGLTGKQLPATALLGGLETAAATDRMRQFRFISAEDDAERATALGMLRQDTEHLRSLVEAYEKIATSPEETDLLSRFKTMWAASEATWMEVVRLKRADRHTEGLRLFRGEGLKAYGTAVAALQESLTLNRRQVESARQDALSVGTIAKNVTMASLAVLVGIGILAVLISVLRVARPIDRMTATMERLASGDATVEVEGQQRSDELGAMARAVQVFKNNLVRGRVLEAEVERGRVEAETRRRAGLDAMADGFEAAVGSIAGMLSAAATELHVTAQTLTGSAAEGATQSNSVATAAEETSANVSTVAAAAEELGASVSEIARQVGGSVTLAAQAVGQADETAGLVRELSQGASRIGDVVGMISGIASQTNLLALNATIEAARAGEAGRGFAVVASEVKELASRTSKATEEIARQITAMQDVTSQAVEAIAGIVGRIREIDASTGSISTAVGQQGAATQEIVRNVAQAAQGAGEVTSGIASVAFASGETGAAATQVLSSSGEVARHAERLSSEMARFLATVRAA